MRSFVRSDETDRTCDAFAQQKSQGSVERVKQKKVPTAFSFANEGKMPKADILFSPPEKVAG
jgi:hypothetical protein